MEKKLLHKYFGGETSPQEEKRIIDWAESSPVNYRKYLEERKIWNALLIHYTSSTEKETVFSSRNKSLISWKIASIAASLALLFSLSWILFTSTESRPQNLQSVLVPAGQRVQLLLEDGTKVWLNSKSSLTYSTTFGKNTREVILNGEGFFEVTKDENKPFIVKTQKYDIKVLGTTFNVYAYDNTKKFETSLLQGSVNISAVNDFSKQIILKPLEKVYEENGILQKKMIDNPDRFRWKDGLICLDDEPFENLMEKFSDYYDIKIIIENKHTLDYRCTGKFRQSDGIEYALKVIQKDLEFNYKRDDESNTITIK